MIDNLEDAVLPSGLTDLLPPFAAHEEALAANLRNCLGSAGYALVVGTVLSLVGAMLPAYRAAKMEPVEAMRVEN